MLLMQEGTDLEAKTNGGVTPLMAGIQSGALHVVNELLEAGCNPTARDLLDQTPADYAKKFTNVGGQNFFEIVQNAEREWLKNN